MSNQDPFEEFEFKPITEGLGFHKKKTNLNIKSEDPLLTPLFEKSELTLIEEESPLFNPPLPRKKTPHLTESETLQAKSSATAQVDEILKTIQKNKRFNFEETKAKTEAPLKEDYKVSALSLSAGFLDTMLIVAASLMCMIIVLLVTRVDLLGSLANPQSNLWIYTATFAVFSLTYFIYSGITRLFMNQTPGEWAFDQRLGLPQKNNSAEFALKVILRSLLNILTGFFLLPVLSAIFKTDFAGRMTGLVLHKKS